MKKIIKFLLLITLIFGTAIPNTTAHAEDKSQYYTIMIKNSQDLRKLASKFQKYNIQIVYTVPEIGVIQVKATEKSMNIVHSDPNIDTYNKSLQSFNSREVVANVNSPVPLNEIWENQWDMQQITHNGDSYSLYSGTKNVTVGIIDSGMDINHPDLKDNISPGSKNLVPKGGFRGQEPQETGEINRLIDLRGHGTFTAGQVAANGFMKGVAPGIGIRMYRVFGNGAGEAIWVIKAIVEAAKDNVDVINLSLGEYLVNGIVSSSDGESREGLSEIKAYEKAIKFAKSKGSVIVAAAGNDSLNVTNKQELNDFFSKKPENIGVTFNGEVLDVPAELPNIVTVSSVGPSKLLSLFSNYGESFIDIAAPGGDNRLFQQYGLEQWIKNKLMLKELILTTAPGGGYSLSVGVSLAAPKVSGALALIIDKNNFKNDPDKAIRYLYKNGISNDAPINKSYYGNGLLDVYKAVSQ
ncbi:S8 family serine peptidase [Bacillus sp. XF8]|uniref:S8 family peptidase n=1 Tax=Bacillus sp. XF8 TaxID=2819289 RepID=UPI001AA021CB|nr:S8 family serine peptidase [Bacillus sp. XF8]MBO1582858.1 S8 family serine peptidase [Bacillus sp. XF8]